jgi:hypothetical protein
MSRGKLTSVGHPSLQRCSRWCEDAERRGAPREYQQLPPPDREPPAQPRSAACASRAARVSARDGIPSLDGVMVRPINRSQAHTDQKTSRRRVEYPGTHYRQELVVRSELNRTGETVLRCHLSEDERWRHSTMVPTLAFRRNGAHPDECDCAERGGKQAPDRDRSALARPTKVRRSSLRSRVGSFSNRRE